MADSVSYAQAAKRCFTSRQNIVHSVREIERELNVTLFERKGNEIVATAAGSQAARQARAIVSDIDELRYLFAKRESNEAVMNLAVSMNLFAGIPQETTAYLSDHADDFRFLEFDCVECYKSVCSGRVDAAFVMCMERVFSECSSICIAVSPAFVLVRDVSPLAQKPSIKAEDLRDAKLALMSEAPFQYMPLFSQLDSLGYDRADASVISSTSTMLNVVRSYDYAGIVSERFAMTPPRGTVAVPFAEAKLNWHFYMLFKRNAQGFGAIIRSVQDIRATFERAQDVQAVAAAKNFAGGGLSKLVSCCRRRPKAA